MYNHIRNIKKLRQKKAFSICVAESCTGGLISSSLTSISGSSDFYEGSIISYSNNLKNKILNVPKKKLDKYGAVSKETAMAMLEGLTKINKSDVLLSVTGVAGPNGGSSKTPVGTVFFGFATKVNNKYKFKIIKKIFTENSRRKIQLKSSEFAFKKIIQEINKI